MVRRSSREHQRFITLDGITLTDRLTTLLDVAGDGEFENAVIAWDFCLNRERSGRSGVSRSVLQRAVNNLPAGAFSRRCSAVLDFTIDNSGSVGESLSRAVIYKLGFPAPTVQQVFHDSAGRHIATTDFYWKHARLVGEFDGRAKYASDEYLRGAAPHSVVVAEKIREDKIRAKGERVVRWLWEDADDAERLRSLLMQAGLQQSYRRLAPGRWRPAA